MVAYVYFGNLSVTEFGKRTRLTLSEEDVAWLKAHHSDRTIHRNDQFHIFDLPSIQIHCGFVIIEELVKRLQKYDWSQSPQVMVKEVFD